MGMDLFSLVARVDLDSTGYKKGVEAVRASTIVLGNLLTDVSRKAIDIGKSLFTTGLQYNRQMEDYTTNFKVMLGSVESAAAKVEELKVMAAKTPFEMSDLADATQTLLAFGVQSSETTKVMTQLGDISLGNAQRFSSLSNAYGKAAAQGKLTGEVVQMMVDAGFNPLLEITKATGESMEALQKRMSAGRVSVDELDIALRNATGEGGRFYKGMEEASKTLSGQLSTLEDNWNAILGEAMSPVSERLSSEILPKAIESLDRLSTALFGVQADSDAAKKSLFTDSEGNEIGSPSANLKTWYEELMKVWTDGETEDDEIVNGFTTEFDKNTNALIGALQKRVDGLSPNPETVRNARQQIAKVKAMQEEVDDILKRNAGKVMSEEDKLRLEQINAILGTTETYLTTLGDFDETIVSPWERFVDATSGIVTTGLETVTDKLVWMTENKDKIKDTMDSLETLGLAFAGGKIGGKVGGGWGVAIGALLGGLGSVGINLAEDQGVTLDKYLMRLSEAWTGLTNEVDTATQAVYDFFVTKPQMFVAQTLPRKIADAWNAVTNAITNAYNAVVAFLGLNEPMPSYGSFTPSTSGYGTVVENLDFDDLHGGQLESANMVTKGIGGKLAHVGGGIAIDYDAMASAFVRALAASGLAFNVDGRTLAYATVGDNMSATSARTKAINIGKVRR